MTTTTDAHEPCQVDRAFTRSRSQGVHEVLERVTGHACEGAGHCASERLMLGRTA